MSWTLRAGRRSHRAPAGTSVPDGDGHQRTADRVTVCLCGLLLAVGLVARFVRLGHQSYWSDELFSATEAIGSLYHLAHYAKTEIHPPLFALVVWAWEHVGHSIRPGWMRLPSAVFGALAPLVALRGLRLVSIDRVARWLAAASIAASGMAFVYAQDLRSYSLLLLAAVGVTVSCLHLTEHGPSRHALVRFAVWGALASATHLFGALFTGWVALVVLMFHPRRWRGVVIATVAALVPQVVWLVIGSTMSGFASGTSWIPAPTLTGVGILVRTIFAGGEVRMQADGFRFDSLYPLRLLGALALLAAIARFLPHQRLRSTSAERRALTGLVLLAVGFPVILFAISQLVHLWTLRNMIVICPALLWLTIWSIRLLPGSAVGRRVVSLLLTIVMAVSFVGVLRSVQTPYKSQYGPAIAELARLRTLHPTMRVYTTGMNSTWLYATDLPPTDAEYSQVVDPVSIISVDAMSALTPSTTTTTAYVMAVRSTKEQPAAAGLVKRGGAGCRQEYFVRVAFVVCEH